MAAAGKRLKMERRPRGFYSRAHLELGRRREMDRWAAAGCLLAAPVVARWSAGRLWRLDCEVWGSEGVVLALYRRRRSVPGQNISPATSTTAPAGWAAVVGPWLALRWFWRGVLSAGRRDDSCRGGVRPACGGSGVNRRCCPTRWLGQAAKPRPGWLAGTGDQARRRPAVA
jgi:hypothetical protein